MPCKNRSIVGLRDLLESNEYAENRKKLLCIAMGLDIRGNPKFIDLSQTSHLLIAGGKGSGKSVWLNSMIISLMFNAKPDELKFIMIDPKGIELGIYNGIPHLLTSVIKNATQAIGGLLWALQEMQNRFSVFEKYSVKNILDYNKLSEKDNGIKKMSHIVIIIDELSELMSSCPADTEDAICRLAQLSGSAGIHLVLVTQSPRADVITGLIKCSLPSRLAFTVSNSLESRMIIDQNGAQLLCNNGDYLFQSSERKTPIRIQAAYICDEEIKKITDYCKNQCIDLYNEEDDLIERAVQLFFKKQTASTSLLQRNLKIGYMKAAKIMDKLEKMGVIGPFEENKPRKILITAEKWKEIRENNKLMDFSS